MKKRVMCVHTELVREAPYYTKGKMETQVLQQRRRLQVLQPLFSTRRRATGIAVVGYRF